MALREASLRAVVIEGEGSGYAQFLHCHQAMLSE
jgi:hypothetical protein